VRIVLSSNTRNWGGVQRVTDILARGMQARGHEIVVFGRSGSVLEERMRGVAPFESTLGRTDLSPRVIARSARALVRHRPDLVVALMKKDVRQTVVAARMLGIPAVIRHYYEQPLPRGLRGRILYGSAAAHVTNAEATRGVLLDSAPWLDPVRVHVIYNGIDATRYINASPVNLDGPKEALRFGFLATIAHRKGIVELAEAWLKVAAQVPTAELVIAGAGRDEKELRQLLQGAPRVQWLGYRNDVPNVLAALDVLVLPSHREGAPNVVLEAMAANVPVIATAVSGTPELVRNGVDAVLVPARDSQSLAAAMIELAGDPEHRRRYADAARLRVQDTFTLDGMLDQYEELFTSVIRS
jgi:glycosyltransferase involved in cell wall biosynthesis